MPNTFKQKKTTRDTAIMNLMKKIKRNIEKETGKPLEKSRPYIEMDKEDFDALKDNNQSK